MLESCQSKKTVIGVLSIALILVISICLITRLDFFGPPKYYAVELENGETWYGQITSEDENLIILTNFYRFHENNFSQLVSHDPRLNLPKEIARDDVFSIGVLSDSSPVLTAILKYESK